MLGEGCGLVVVRNLDVGQAGMANRPFAIFLSTRLAWASRRAFDLIFWVPHK